MKVDVRSLGAGIATLAWVALRSFVGTFLAFMLIGSVSAGLSYYFLRDHGWLWGLTAVAVALVESVALGVILGAKQAMVGALAHGLGKLHLGRSFVGLVFERMLPLDGSSEGGDRGGPVSRRLERLPLAQAEQLLSAAILAVAGDAERCGWLRRKIRDRLLEVVRRYTLARFRDEESAHGGIDLLRAKEELEQSADEALIRKVRQGLMLWTVLAVIGLPLVVAAQTWAAVLLLRPGS